MTRTIGPAATLNFIRLELAGSPDFPQGSPRHGYEFVAPLTEDGRIDPIAWNTVRDRCEMTRVWGNDPFQFGRLRHVGRGWRFDYDDQKASNDEPLFELGQFALKPGAQLTIKEQDGVKRPFRVASVIPVVKPSHN